MRVTALIELVRRLLTYQIAEGQDQTSLLEAAEQVAAKLRLHLSRRIGSEGFRTLLARALTLATSRFPHLRTVRVVADGSLVGLKGTAENISQETVDSVEPDEAVEGAVVLLAHFVGLLVTLIGEELTRHLLGTIWPLLASDDVDNDADNDPDSDADNEESESL